MTQEFSPTRRGFAMASNKLWLLWLVIGIVAAGGVGSCRAAAAEKEAKGSVIPAWLDAYGEPRVNVSLSFLGKKKPVRLGQLLPKNLTQIRPNVSLHVPPLYANSLLSLVTVDPDAPSPASPVRSNILHWIVSNIPAAHISHEEIWKLGVENFVYAGPAPPNGTHRYYTLIFEQKEKINVEPIVNRTGFSVRKFTRKYDLYYPIGGTFFRVRASSTT